MSFILIVFLFAPLFLTPPLPPVPHVASILARQRAQSTAPSASADPVPPAQPTPPAQPNQPEPIQPELSPPAAQPTPLTEPAPPAQSSQGAQPERVTATAPADSTSGKGETSPSMPKSTWALRRRSWYEELSIPGLGGWERYSHRGFPLAPW